MEMTKFSDTMPDCDELLIVTENTDSGCPAIFKLLLDDDDNYYLRNMYSGEEFDDVDDFEDNYWGYAPGFEYPVEHEPEPAPAKAPAVSGYKIVNGMVVKA